MTMARNVANTNNDVIAPVVYVERKDAKTAKNELEAKKMLNKSLRMVVAKDNDQWIAIPVLATTKNDTTASTTPSPLLLSVPILGQGLHECPCSNSHHHATRSCEEAASSLTEIQTILVQMTPRAHATASDHDVETILSKVRALSLECCPTKLEVLGTDRTVVIPRKALHMDGLRVLGEFWTEEQAYPLLWRALAAAYGSSRVVRRGEVDPNSPIRHSQYQLLWYANKSSLDDDDNDAAKWITVVEDGIHQSFHLERLMFSRGNITEKMRFGRTLVRPGEEVLDLYAGIGYFSLPAAVHGQARHVTCCEWNPVAGTYIIHPSVVSPAGTQARKMPTDGHQRRKEQPNNSTVCFFLLLASGSVAAQYSTQPSTRHCDGDTGRLSIVDARTHVRSG
jgi:tRNA G37 N-methylase Trm5